MSIAQQLKDPTLFKQLCYIDGAWAGAPSGTTVPVDNPATGEVIGNVPSLGKDDADKAIAAADRAFKTWRKKTAGERAALLERWFELMIENTDDLARIMTLEQGKPLAEARGEVAYGGSFVKWFAEEARRVYGETIPAASADARIIVQKHPIGVVAAITPWNFPNAMITRKAAPALAAGCTIVIKPAESTPFSALALGVLAERAGIPKGVINIVTGAPAEIGAGNDPAAPSVRKLTFTGSTRVGKLLMEQCAQTVKRVGLELGGNAPFLIFDDADLDAAVAGVMTSKFRNGGQTCVCANRILVQDGVYDAFAEKLAAAAAKLVVGDGLSEGTTIGPMINKAAISKIQEHVDDATSQGAKVVLGGQGSFGPVLRAYRPEKRDGGDASSLGRRRSARWRRSSASRRRIRRSIGPTTRRSAWPPTSTHGTSPVLSAWRKPSNSAWWASMQDRSRRPPRRSVASRNRASAARDRIMASRSFSR
jgi:succinate-semialdehyde dehydrogenase/glutarate-semialdehyde dehydrogenase